MVVQRVRGPCAACAAALHPPPPRRLAARAPARSPHPLSLEDADARVKSALVNLLGNEAVRSFLRLDDVLRKFVATVDNLATDNATAQMWPVSPTAGRFDTEARDGAVAIGADQEPLARAPGPRFQHTASGRPVRALPLLQRAYEELGYPAALFDDRVIEVMDNLLATPKVAGPVKVKRVVVDGAAPSSGAGLYVFEIPA